MIKFTKQSYSHKDKRIIEIGEVLDFGNEHNNAIVKAGFAEHLKLETKPKKEKLETK